MFVNRRQLIGITAGGFASAIVPEDWIATNAAADITIPTATGTTAFDIVRDGKRVGEHRVAIERGGDGIAATTTIDIIVKLGFITLFRFEHEGVEIWRDGHLALLESWTNRNGDKFRIDCAKTPDGLRMETSQGPFTAPPDYWTSDDIWNPSILKRASLIDAQHGGVIGLTASEVGMEKTEIGGDQVMTKRYRVITPYLAGNVWYDDADRWVKARFEFRGETLDYVLKT